ncbi:hypothetical protein GCM10027167_47260 [Nocardia heshunensis]
MGTDIEVEPGTITKEHVRTTAPRNYPAEQVPGHLVRTQPTVTVERARHPEFGLDPHDSSLHPIDITALKSPVTGLSDSLCKRIHNDLARGATLHAVQPAKKQGSFALCY